MNAEVLASLDNLRTISLYTYKLPLTFLFTHTNSTMQFGNIFFTLALATQGLASPTPLENSLVARSCAGSKAGCNTMANGACDKAADKVVDDKVYFTG